MEPTRERLVDAATRLLDEGGPAAVTLREVGRLAGVSHNAPYKHFTDKEDLLAAIAARELRSSDRTTPTHGADELMRMMTAYARRARKYPERFKLTFGRWSSGSPELATTANAARQRLVDAVRRAQDAGELPAGDPERLASLIHAVAHGAADLAISGHLAKRGKGHADPEDLINDLLTHLRPSHHSAERRHANRRSQ